MSFYFTEIGLPCFCKLQVFLTFLHLYNLLLPQNNFCRLLIPCRIFLNGCSIFILQSQPNMIEVMFNCIICHALLVLLQFITWKLVSLTNESLINKFLFVCVFSTLVFILSQEWIGLLYCKLHCSLHRIYMNSTVAGMRNYVYY